MSFIHPDIMVPIKLRLYSDYKIAAVRDFILEILPNQSQQLIEGLERLKADSDGGIALLEREVIYPTRGAKYKEYNPWDYLYESALRDFTALWNFGEAPSDNQLLGWIRRYGLPCNAMVSTSLHSIWDIDAFSSDYIRCLNEASGLFQLVGIDADPEIESKDGYDELYFIARHVMFKDLMLELLKELRYSTELIEALLNRSASFPAGIDAQTMYFIKYNHDWNSNWLDKGFDDSSYRLDLWQSLRDRITARLRGLRISMKAKSLPSFPNFELRHAFEAEDLLTVLWVRFYDLMLGMSPMDKCECGAVFKKERPNQKYCSKSCQNKYNVQGYRAKKKRENLSEER